MGPNSKVGSGRHLANLLTCEAVRTSILFGRNNSGFASRCGADRGTFQRRDLFDELCRYQWQQTLHR